MNQILSAGASTVAPRLLGCELVREIDGEKLAGRIVETEAYDQTDAASHSYRGKTPRTDVMFGPAGHAYVYFTYGMHYCMNIVTGPAGHGSAVLIRALEPLIGEALMSGNRHGATGKNITDGPAKLCQALMIDRSFNGHDLNKPPLRLNIKHPLPQSQIIQATRIGISRETDRLWRFFVKDNAYVSRQN